MFSANYYLWLKVVDQKSATLGIAKRETMIALEADHKQVCKFESESDDNYEQVIGNILEMAEGAVGKYLGSETPQTNPPQTNPPQTNPSQTNQQQTNQQTNPPNARRESDASYTIRYTTLEVTRSSGRGP